MYQLKVLVTPWTRNPDILNIAVACNQCHQLFELITSREKWDRFLAARTPVQEIFPHATPGQRELLLSGLCETCWEVAFPDDLDDLIA